MASPPPLPPSFQAVIAGFPTSAPPVSPMPSLSLPAVPPSQSIPPSSFSHTPAPPPPVQQLIHPSSVPPSGRSLVPAGSLVSCPPLSSDNQLVTKSDAGACAVPTRCLRRLKQKLVRWIESRSQPSSKKTRIDGKIVKSLRSHSPPSVTLSEQSLMDSTSSSMVNVSMCHQ